MQGELATAEERLRSARLEAALAEHVAKVAAGVSQMREGGALEHAIAVYEAEQALEEAKIEACLPRPQVATLPGNFFWSRPQACDLSRLYLRFGAWVQEDLAGAEERLRSAKLAAALAEHVAKVAGVVVEMREGGASEHAIAVYEAEQALEEAKMGTAEVRKCPSSQPSPDSEALSNGDLSAR